MAEIRPHNHLLVSGWPITRVCGSNFTIGGMRQKHGHKFWRSILSRHASWIENFPWTRLANVTVPAKQKPMSDFDYLRQLDPRSLRDYLKDGNYGGHYQRDDEEMMKIWRIGVEETRQLLEDF